MKPPSHIYRKQVAQLTGDSMFLAGVRKDIAKGDVVRQGLEGKFGVILMLTIEQVERELYSKVIEMKAWRVFEHIRARAELSAIQFLKSRLLAYVDNRDALFEEMEREEYEYD
jgi:hypothetical protein